MPATIDVAEYCKAFETWAGVTPDEERGLTARAVELQRAFISAGCDHIRSSFTGKVEIARLCKSFVAWAKSEEEIQGQRTYRGRIRDTSVQSLIGDIRLAIGKSSLLYRMIYAGEPLRLKACPIHNGHWSGSHGDPCPAGCNFGDTRTGWLPNV
jgi:hypothetical protein